MASPADRHLYAILLRGINVGGKRPVPMGPLREALEAAGLREVRTYVQSGNVVIRRQPGEQGEVREESPESAIARTVRTAIESSFGLDVPVIVRSYPALLRARDGNPFAAIEGVTPVQLHVGFLDRVPEADLVAQVDLEGALPDRLSIDGDVIYAYCRNGLGRSRVLNGLERKLATAMTVRNWNTLMKLIALCED